ncbi:hypothetical protein BKP56_10570 [Marinilactibacillus sp. 15R]|uniref:hypothetical protein n=1 Tax=Marinilactibacillus sp. 15R TaxID=1911586 RepID=UPI00090C439D|nr:hypothetical protein [Marinilactibacillus sp. 15R]API89674.1 hypothetical protein BKP56_10570 [Marinilactibacillus sp. 15R]
MFNYIKADLYRLFHKKSNYIFYSIVFTLFIAVVIIARTSVEGELSFAEGYLQLGIILLTQFFPLVFGLQAYVAVFTNDLSANTYQNIFTNGISKVEFVIGKAITMIIYLLTTFLSGAVLYSLIYVILLMTEDGPIDFESFGNLAVVSITIFLGMLGYAAVANILAYFSQNSTISIITMGALVSGVILQLFNLVSLFTDKIEFLREYTLSYHMNEASNQMMGSIIGGETAYSASFQAWGVALIYLVIASIIGIIVLNKIETKEGK